MVERERLRIRSYDDKKMTLKETMKYIKTGDHIFIGSACGEPQYFVRGLVREADHLKDNEILHMHTLGAIPYAKPIYSERFRSTLLLSMMNLYLRKSQLFR